MKNITLKEYFEIKGIKRDGVMNYSQFANMLGISVSYISKIVNCQPVAVKENGKFKILKEYVAKDGYNLVFGDIYSLGMNAILKENDKVKDENRLLKLENEILKDQLKQYESLIKMCDLVVQNQKNLQQLTFECRRKKYNKRVDCNE